HLIFCDIMLPELDGYGVLRVLGKLPETAGIPFIFLTAKSEKEDFRKGMSMGADDYLTKPFDDVELLDIIELRLRKNQIARKEYSNDVDGIADFMNDAKALNELSHLSADRTIRKFKKKEIIFYEGNLPHGLFFVNSGKAKTYKTNDDGKEYITGLFKEGDFIGYIDLLQNSNYTESAMAMEDSEICLIPKQDFYKLLNSNRDVSIRFIKMISNNLVEMEERILKLAYNSVRKRVAEALVMLEDKFKEKNEGEEFNMNIPREDLANIVGTAPESVIRTLSDFKDEKLIEIKGSNIKITNSAGLRKMRN
ncbi:MAG: cyclic nucleotide-binding domain-containing protein, partial [Imperialibacter sp.]